MTMPINPPTPTHAFISQTTFTVTDGDGKETMLPGVFTANHWQDGEMEIYIQPIGALHCNIAQITVLIDHQDLAHVNALLHAQDRAQAAPTHPSDPSNPSNPSDAPCYDCRTNQTRLDTLDSEYATLTQALDVIRIYQRMHGQRITDIERRLRQVMGLLDALVDEMHAPAMTNPDAPLEACDATPTHP